MPWWAWLGVGVVVGAAGYLVVGNTIAWRRARRRAPAPSAATGSPYIATRTRGRTVNFKSEDEWEGEAVGPVFITDGDDPEFLHEVGWLKLSDARELARSLGHAFNAD